MLSLIYWVLSGQYKCTNGMVLHVLPDIYLFIYLFIYIHYFKRVNTFSVTAIIPCGPHTTNTTATIHGQLSENKHYTRISLSHLDWRVQAG